MWYGFGIGGRLQGAEVDCVWKRVRFLSDGEESEEFLCMYGKEK